MSKRSSKIVEELLAEYQRCRDSDSDLIIGVLYMLGANLTPEQKNIIRSVNFEGITRHRRKLQEAGKYMPSPEVAKKRRLKSYIIEQNAPTAKAEYLDELIQTQPEQGSLL